MKNSNNTLLAAVFTATLAATTAYSQPVITVDEFGNGDISGTPLASGLALLLGLLFAAIVVIAAFRRASPRLSVAAATSISAADAVGRGGGRS